MSADLVKHQSAYHPEKDRDRRVGTLAAQSMCPKFHSAAVPITTYKVGFSRYCREGLPVRAGVAPMTAWFVVL